MRISKAEIATQGLKVKSWLSGLNAVVKEGKSPEFPLKGPCDFLVRKRYSGVRATGSIGYAFNGSEKFALSDIFVEQTSVTDDVIVGVTIVPTDLDLVAEFSSATMELGEMIELFDGVEEWFVEARRKASERAPAVDPVLLKPHIEKAEDRADWGAW